MEEKQYTREELEKKLTYKEKNFCKEFIIDWNGSRAARAAGYSKNTDTEIASQNLAKLHIKQYIDFIRNDFESEAGVSKLMAVKELKKMAFINFEELHDNWFTRKDFNDLPSDVKACIQEIDTKVLKKNIGTVENPEIVDVEYVRIKLTDKRGALQDLAKLLGWNEVEKHQFEFKEQIKGIAYDE